MAVRILTAGAVVALSATQALALSCAEPNVERSFNAWVDSDERHYIGVGTLTPLEEPTQKAPIKIPHGLKLGGGFGSKGPITAKYLFAGELLDGEQGHPYEMPITVNVTCAGPWCGSFPKTGTVGLMALRGVGIQNLSLDMHACPGSIFPAGTKATVQACIREGRCADR